MTYIDFDGVILDTEELLFEKWRKNPDRFKLPEEVKIEYIKKANWEYIIRNSEIINDSIYFLKETNPDKSFILTKVHSLKNEGQAKVKYLREQGIKQSIILVPYTMKKTDVVEARGNTLIDDSLRNLSEWENNGGYPIFFDIDDDDYDSWQQPNIKQYKKVNNLSSIVNKTK